MAQWHLQSPDNFPPAFHAALRFPIGEDWVIDRYHTRQAAVAAQKRWNLFCYCMRELPSHRLATELWRYKRRTEVGYGIRVKSWELRVSVRETAESLIAAMIEEKESPSSSNSS